MAQIVSPEGRVTSITRDSAAVLREGDILKIEQLGFFVVEKRVFEFEVHTPTTHTRSGTTIHVTKVGDVEDETAVLFNLLNQE